MNELFRIMCTLIVTLFSIGVSIKLASRHRKKPGIAGEWEELIYIPYVIGGTLVGFLLSALVEIFV